MRLSLVVMLVAAPAFAGQLIVEHYGLADARKDGVSVFAGTVESFAKGKEKNDFSLTVKVTRVFNAGTLAAAPLGLADLNGPSPKVGSSYTCTVYDGVVWDDPGRSLMDRRLRNAVGPKVAKGKLVYLVPQFSGTNRVELLEGTPANLTRIEVNYDDEARKKWLASADAVLETALGDDELSGLAFPELSRRGTIRAGALLKADEKVARAYLLKLPAPARATFFRDALGLAKSDPEARDALYELACQELRSVWIADVAPLMELFPADESDAGQRFYGLRDELGDLVSRVKEKEEKQRPDLSPFVPYLARYLLARPGHRSTDEELPELFPFLSAAAKQQLAIELINGMPKSTASKPDDPDLYVLDVAATLVKQAPSLTALDALAKVDPSTVRVTSTREETMGLLLNIGASIARGNPAARKKVQDVLEPWLVNGVEVNADELKTWRRVMPAWKPSAPIATTFEIVPGQVRRMNTGARVSFLTQEKDFGLEWAEGDGATTTWFTPTEDWYREVYVKPWLLIFERVGQEAKLKVKATPAPKLAPLDDPKTHDLVEKQAKQDGCPQYEAAEYDEQKGTFTYEGSGEKGRKCRYTFGIFTRTFPRKSITP